MGALISRLRAKPSTKELLEDLEKEIVALEEYKSSTEQQHKRVIGSLIFYFILIFIIGAGVFFLYYFPVLVTTKDKIIYSIPLGLVPVLFYFLKKILHWYFKQKIKYNEENLAQLKKKRKSLLEFAMETETYKVVKELLITYDPDYHKKVFELPAIEAPRSLSRGAFGDFEMKKRSPPPSRMPPLPVLSPGQAIAFRTAGPSQFFPPFPGKSHTNTQFLPPYLQRPVAQQFVRPPVQPTTPRPVLPRERSLVDRIVDYLVGDGPSNRYALICRQCQSHNGMAMKEEFEYVAFRCCYCFHWNPPRSQQPPALRSSSSPPPLPAVTSSSPIVTEPLELSGSGGGEDTETDSFHSGGADEAKDVKECELSGSGRSSPHEELESGCSSPQSTSLRQRLSTSVSSEKGEVNAILEEDRTNFIKGYYKVD